MFYLNGISNIELGVIALEEDFLSVAAIRYNEISIEGRDGLLYEKNGRADVIYNIALQVLNINKLDDLKSFFNGTIELKFRNRITYFNVYDECVITRNASSVIFNLPIIRHPFWYASNDVYQMVQNEVANTGNELAKPIVKLIGSGSVDLTINGTRFIYHFDEDKEVVIDCDKKTETFEGISKSKNIEIGFNYPILIPGSNIVTVHDGVVEIHIKRKDCWL